MAADDTTITELVRALGLGGILNELGRAGCKVAGTRGQCPSPGCAKKGPKRGPDIQAFMGKGAHPRWKCHACEAKGDLVDLLELTRGITKGEAVAYLKGTAPSRPALRVVATPAPAVEAVDDSKLKPEAVAKLWEALSHSDNEAEEYLASRGLEGAAEAGLVRFSHASLPDRGMASHAGRGHRIVALMRDVLGRPRAMQMRYVGSPSSSQTKIMTLRGSSPGLSFFGEPERIEESLVVLVCEGLADTLAVQLWSERAHPVVGAAGKDNLHKLAKELKAKGIALEGKLFCLFAQNDGNPPKSRIAFDQLAGELREAGAVVEYVNTPAHFKDVADWRQGRPEEAWPPPDLHRALLPPEEQALDQQQVVPEGCTVPLPKRFSVKANAQDLSTLAAILDDPHHRASLLGSGELTWDVMTEGVRVGGKPLVDADITALRVALEQHEVSGTKKRLRFKGEEVAGALEMVARRTPVHRARAYLEGLAWDGTSRMDELTVVLGHDPTAAPLQRALLRRWLVSAVARPMSPGCKADTVLVLVGPQGLGKSSFFSTLAGELFTDSPVSVGDKDGLLVMREAWVVEWAELDALRRARDQEAVKAFLSSPVDHFRKPYGRTVVRSPRHSVIVGTTNEKGFLHDTTGHRRFWPVEVLQPVDVPWLRQHRDQLWAEAVALYRAGEQWWLTEAEDEALRSLHQEHEAVDPWLEPVADWLESHPHLAELNTSLVLKGAIDKKQDTWTRGDLMRVGNILRQLGWVGPVRARRDGALRWTWLPPGSFSRQTRGQP